MYRNQWYIENKWLWPSNNRWCSVGSLIVVTVITVKGEGETRNRQRKEEQYKRRRSIIVLPGQIIKGKEFQQKRRWHLTNKEEGVGEQQQQQKKCDNGKWFERRRKRVEDGV